ncbi:hypothetical protein IJH33_01795 [Candidatus Saccharibacteria bacterium]|nr:hypothetical protein [Candidatus Saccharibacteria bacterium]
MEEKNELSRRIATDLRERQKKSEQVEAARTDFTDDTDYLNETKKTGRFAWVWAVLIVLAIGSVVVIATAGR